MDSKSKVIADDEILSNFMQISFLMYTMMKSLKQKPPVQVNGHNFVLFLQATAN
jgi:hypothetical protein